MIWTVNNSVIYQSIVLKLLDNEKTEYNPDVITDRTSANTRVLTGLKPNNSYTIFLYTRNSANQDSSPIQMRFTTVLRDSKLDFQSTQPVFCEKAVLKNFGKFK